MEARGHFVLPGMRAHRREGCADILRRSPGDVADQELELEQHFILAGDDPMRIERQLEGIGAGQGGRCRLHGHRERPGRPRSALQTRRRLDRRHRDRH
ncbi:hypothetical protein, partial [Staphylococcus aureus]|uniref:hypothetical protein n=1 Tax=Staphylococcus aureus TaxID=1280 RepID=UPI00123E5333